MTVVYPSYLGAPHYEATSQTKHEHRNHSLWQKALEAWRVFLGQ